MAHENILSTLLLLLSTHLALYAQRAFAFKEAEEQGIYINPDSTYSSALRANTSKAVFKTEAEQESMFAHYSKLLQDLGTFLQKNNFKWQKPTKASNRIYFSSNGSKVGSNDPHLKRK